MGKIEKIEQEVQALSPEERAQFRAALRDHAAGKTTPIKPTRI